MIKTANDAVGRTPATRAKNNLGVGEFETRTVDRQFNAPVDRSNPYGFDVNKQNYRPSLKNTGDPFDDIQ